MASSGIVIHVTAQGTTPASELAAGRHRRHTCWERRRGAAGEVISALGRRLPGFAAFPREAPSVRPVEWGLAHRGRAPPCAGLEAGGGVRYRAISRRYLPPPPPPPPPPPRPRRPQAALGQDGPPEFNNGAYFIRRPLARPPATSPALLASAAPPSPASTVRPVAAQAAYRPLLTASAGGRQQAGSAGSPLAGPGAALLARWVPRRVPDWPHAPPPQGSLAAAARSLPVYLRSRPENYSLPAPTRHNAVLTNKAALEAGYWEDAPASD
ncbi:formin-like protein 5 [Schistocerca americana]|uniref:formin-like protein 5 n=1 Tax=Schistocerca americana TaxID=7009 RepID=UPI001F4FEFED|nr:formin-like protein 5 [Schistocerca americana]